MIVNIVSKVPPDIWNRELPSGMAVDFVHSDVPVPADVHVIYGVRDAMVVPNSWNRLLFVASEPPEIRHYNLRISRACKASAISSS
jgi:hypothetical protein